MIWSVGHEAVSHSPLASADMLVVDVVVVAAVAVVVVVDQMFCFVSE